MKVSYSQLLDTRGILKQLVTEWRPTARVSAKLARNIRLINRELEDYDAAIKKLIEGMTIKEDGTVDVPEADKQRVDTEYVALQNAEVEVDIHPITVADLEDCERAMRFDGAPTTLELVRYPLLFDVEVKEG